MWGYSKSALVIVLAGVSALTLATPAGAAVTCTFNTDLLDVQISESDDSAVFGIGGGGTILVNNGATPVPCGPGGPPTVDNTETVAVVDNSDDPATPTPFDGDTSVVIHDPASFAPGKTVESGSAQFSEIEFAVNSNDGSDDFELQGADPGADTWVVGSGGINWNAGVADPVPDAELAAFSRFRELTLEPRGGNDAVSARGGAGTGAPYDDSPLELEGGSGDDLLEGGDMAGGDQFEDGPGDDEVRGFAGSDFLQSGDGRDTYSGGPDTDELSYFEASTGVDIDLDLTGPQDTLGAGIDTIAGVENLTASEFDDTLVGTPGPNQLIAGSGDDSLDGGAGDDSLFGTDGVDTARYAGASAAVNANLAVGTATGGGGTDMLSGFENLVGSPFGDTLIGSSLANAIEGRAGSDTVSALGGPDAVDVRDGEADTATCGSEVDSAVADRASLDVVESDCEAVDFLAEPPGGGGGSDTEVSFDLSGKSRQRLLKRKAVVVTATCPLEPCTATVSGSGRLPKPKRAPRAKLKLKPVTAELDGGAARKLRLELKRRQLRALAAALRAGKEPKVKVSASGTDSAGNSAADALTVRASR